MTRVVPTPGGPGEAGAAGGHVSGARVEVGLSDTSRPGAGAHGIEVKLGEERERERGVAVLC